MLTYIDFSTSLYILLSLNFLTIRSSVTSKKSPNVYKSFPKMISQDK